MFIYDELENNELGAEGHEYIPKEIGSIAKIEWFAAHLLPLLLLRVAQNRLNPALLFLADLFDLRPDLLRVAAGLRPLDERSNSLLHLLHHLHELVPLLVGDLQLIPEVGPGEHGERSFLLNLQFSQPFNLLVLQG